MATTTFVSKVNSKDIYAKRAESSKNGVNIDTKFSSLDGSIGDLNTALGNKENTSNKKQSINDSSTTDYPSSKAVADFVNSSVATNTANYISNNGEPFTSVAQLEAYSGTVTNNDYAFVTGTDSAGNTYYDRYKATVNASTTPATVTWSKEYRLNNSSFTATQWTSINSGITSTDVTSIGNKVDKVTSGVTNNFVSFGTSGAIKDSGKKASDFATSTQGGKADTAIQGVKLAGASSALTPDSSKVVTIPNAVATGTTGATNGLMTANDKQSLDNAVHKVGDETITGIKTFSNDVSPIYSNSANNKTRQSKIFTPTFISEYSTWTSAQKDGNHYRQWTIDVTDIIVDKNVTASVFIVMHGSYFNTSANGTLAKLITFRKNATNYINNSQEDYVVSQSPCSEEYVISGLLKESDRFKFKVINKAPANNNFPVNLLIDITVDTLTNLNTCTLTEEIVEGWPEWAGDKAATIKVTASGSPVLTEGSLSNYKTKQSAVSVTGGTLKGVASFSQNANGEVTLTLNNIRTGSTSQTGVLQLEDSHTSTSTTKAATPKNVKEAYDLANSAVHDSSYVHTDNNFTSGYKTQVDSNTSARHTHSNKTVLDGISSTDVSNWNAKANDGDVVHKAGSETITGAKTFNSNMSPRQIGDSFAKQSKVFACSVITPYADWTASQKDGNHYRTWTIDLTSVIVTASAHGNVIIKMMGSYYSTPGNGALEKVITFQIHNGNVVISKGDYNVAQAPCSEEFAISELFKSGSSYVIQVVNRNPTANNYPLRLELEMFNRYNSAVLDNVTVTEAITEGWPSWAGDKNSAVVIQSNGMDVVRVGDIATEAKRVHAVWHYWNTSATTKWYNVLSVSQDGGNSSGYAGDMYAVTLRDSADNNCQCILTICGNSGGNVLDARLFAVKARTGNWASTKIYLYRQDDSNYTIYAKLERYGGIKIAPIVCQGTITYGTSVYDSQPSGTVEVDDRVQAFNYEVVTGSVPSTPSVGKFYLIS